MNKNTGLIIASGAVLLLILSTKTANAATQGGNLQLSDLTNNENLNAIYGELLIRGYTDQQILYMLSQILFETGMLTDVANYHLMSQNNFAGLTNVGGGYAAYNTISDFVDAYDGFLTKNNNPLGASSLADFNTRLRANGYYTEDPNVYYNGLLHYYNLLIGTE